ncbi:alpha/beta hydrolase, partial [filamentous cyanobacterium CCP5]
RERYVNLAGPLDVREFGWDDLQFPLGCFTAANQFGAFVRKTDNVAALRPKPTLMVLTENEDAADIETNQRFFEKIGGAQNGHAMHLYPAEAMVPHPMVDPTEVSQGMSNQFWQSLYQETFRFLKEGRVEDKNFSSLEQAGDLPAVPPV